MAWCWLRIASPYPSPTRTHAGVDCCRRAADRGEAGSLDFAKSVFRLRPEPQRR